MTFRYRDYAQGRGQPPMTLLAEEFLRRFRQHVLPKGFAKVRHYGLLANRQREAKLAICQSLLLVAMSVTTPPSGDNSLRIEPVIIGTRLTTTAANSFLTDPRIVIGCAGVRHPVLTVFDRPRPNPD